MLTDVYLYLLHHYLYTELTTVSSVVRDLGKVHTTGMIGRQGMFTSPRHLIPPPIKSRSMFAQSLIFDHHKTSTFRWFSLLWHFPDYDINLNHDMPNCDKEHTAGATDQQGNFS